MGAIGTGLAIANRADRLDEGKIGIKEPHG
jgi:hypothetical protein